MCRWTEYDFPVITIDTGYLIRPNWLLAGYSFYHRVASQPGSQPTMFMSGPRSRHQRRCVRDASYFKECMMIHSRIESPSVPVPTNLESTLDRETLSPSQGMHMQVFSKVYCDRVYFGNKIKLQYLQVVVIIFCLDFLPLFSLFVFSTGHLIYL